jgi:hypothetical protein
LCLSWGRCLRCGRREERGAASRCVVLRRRRDERKSLLSLATTGVGALTRYSFPLPSRRRSRGVRKTLPVLLPRLAFFPRPSSLPSPRYDTNATHSAWCWSTQVVQADDIAHQIAFYRRGSGMRERQMGALYWMLNDLWCVLGVLFHFRVFGFWAGFVSFSLPPTIPSVDGGERRGENEEMERVRESNIGRRG